MSEKNDNEEKSPEEMEIKAELEERPEMGPVVEEVHVIIPKRPEEDRQRTLKFLEGIEMAYAVRANDGEVQLEVKGDEMKVYRELEGGKIEMRYYRKGKDGAIIFCDERELENLRSMGLVKMSDEV